MAPRDSCALHTCGILVFITVLSYNGRVPIRSQPNSRAEVSGRPDVQFVPSRLSVFVVCVVFSGTSDLGRLTEVSGQSPAATSKISAPAAKPTAPAPKTEADYQAGSTSSETCAGHRGYC